MISRNLIPVFFWLQLLLASQILLHFSKDGSDFYDLGILRTFICENYLPSSSNFDANNTVFDSIDLKHNDMKHIDKKSFDMLIEGLEDPKKLVLEDQFDFYEFCKIFSLYRADSSGECFKDEPIQILKKHLDSSMKTKIDNLIRRTSELIFSNDKLLTSILEIDKSINIVPIKSMIALIFQLAAEDSRCAFTSNWLTDNAKIQDECDGEDVASFSDFAGPFQYDLNTVTTLQIGTSKFNLGGSCWNLKKLMLFVVFFDIEGLNVSCDHVFESKDIISFLEVANFGSDAKYTLNLKELDFELCVFDELAFYALVKFVKCLNLQLKSLGLTLSFKPNKMVEDFLLEQTNLQYLTFRGKAHTLTNEFVLKLRNTIPGIIVFR